MRAAFLARGAPSRICTRGRVGKLVILSFLRIRGVCMALVRVKVRGKDLSARWAVEGRSKQKQIANVRAREYKFFIVS